MNTIICGGALRDRRHGKAKTHTLLSGAVPILIELDSHRKIGVKASRKRAGLDNDYLLDLLRLAHIPCDGPVANMQSIINAGSRRGAMDEKR
jgi:hypothetical protein